MRSRQTGSITSAIPGKPSPGAKSSMVPTLGPGGQGRPRLPYGNGSRFLGSDPGFLGSFWGSPSDAEGEEYSSDALLFCTFGEALIFRGFGVRISPPPLCPAYVFRPFAERLHLGLHLGLHYRGPPCGPRRARLA